MWSYELRRGGSPARLLRVPPSAARRLLHSWALGWLRPRPRSFQGCMDFVGSLKRCGDECSEGRRMWLLQQKHPTSDGLGANAQCKNAVTKLLRSRSVVIKYQCRNEQNQEGRTLSVVLCGGILQFFRQAAVTACRAAAVKKKGVKAGTEIPKNTSNHSGYLEPHPVSSCTRSPQSCRTEMTTPACASLP